MKTFKVYSLITENVTVWTDRELELHFQKLNHYAPKITRLSSSMLKRQVREVREILRNGPFRSGHLFIKND